MYFNKETLCGNFKSKFILIKDSSEISGIKLLKAILNLYLKENANLHIIYYELINFNLVPNQGDGKSDVTITNAVLDPFGWNKNEVGKQNALSLNVLYNLCSEYKGVVCIDSLSPMLLFNEPNSVYKLLHKILKENDDLQIVALMHTDVHGEYESEILSKLASTVLNVLPSEDKLLSTIHYSTGKVSNQLVEFKISDQFEFSVLRDMNMQMKSAPLKQPDPTANLTFNLRLKDNEKEARSQLQLPYMQMQNKDIIEADIDMYDEEDPDDDLDI